jgi:hypothetical protein
LNSAQSVVQGGGNAIAMSSSGSAAALIGTSGTADSVSAINDLLYLNGAQASVTGNGNTLVMTGATATVSGNSDGFAFQAAFGQNSITGFGSTDTAQFAASYFANWAALQSHMTQSGANTLITLDASDTVTLANVAMSSLQASQFSFK